MEIQDQSLSNNGNQLKAKQVRNQSDTLKIGDLSESKKMTDHDLIK